MPHLDKDSPKLAQHIPPESINQTLAYAYYILSITLGQPQPPERGWDTLFGAGQREDCPDRSFGACFTV